LGNDARNNLSDKELTMLNLAFALVPSLGSAPGNPKLGRLGRLAGWLRERSLYRHALRELDQLDGRDLDELNLGRADFPALAERHAAGLAPLTPSQMGSLRRL
jgi:uncharacterized protein YjiS (DUF1127 family)